MHLTLILSADFVNDNFLFLSHDSRIARQKAVIIVYLHLSRSMWDIHSIPGVLNTGGKTTDRLPLLRTMKREVRLISNKAALDLTICSAQ